MRDETGILDILENQIQCVQQSQVDNIMDADTVSTYGKSILFGHFVLSSVIHLKIDGVRYRILSFNEARLR